MTPSESRITIPMVASLDGFIARQNGKDVALRLVEVEAYARGMVALCHEVRK